MLGSIRFIIFSCALLTVNAQTAYSCPDTLPTYTVHTHKPTANETLELAQNLFGPDHYNVTFWDQRFVVFSLDGTKRIEYDTVSGGIWATDESALWNTEGPAPDLPSDADAIEMADALVAKLNLLPPEGGPVMVSSGRISGTFLAHECKPGYGSGGYERQEYPLDISVNYDITLSISHMKFPIVGGGGKFQVTYGSCGKLIAFQGLFREIVGQTSFMTIPQAQADAQYLANAGCLSDTVQFNSTMAYFSSPFGIFQEAMYPVYVHTGIAQVQDEVVTLRPEISRGSDYTGKGPKIGRRRSLRQSDALRPRTGDDDMREAATEWLGTRYGLMLSDENAAGFRAGIRAAYPLWTIKYDRSNEDVWESDFTTDDDSYVDSVDMLFYTGHANQNGWMANEPGTHTGARKWVDYTSMGTSPENPGDLLGQQDLEWLLIAACGPHQDESFDPSAGNVFDRWRGIFDGLHVMFAYGSTSYDSSEEGSRFTKYAMESYRLIDSWFRMAKEAQSSEVIVTAMWTDGPGGNARNDHLPGYGWVSEDNLGSSQCRWFMSTKC